MHTSDPVLDQPAGNVPQQYHGALLLGPDDIGLEKVTSCVAGIAGSPMGSCRVAWHIGAGKHERSRLVIAATHAQPPMFLPVARAFPASPFTLLHRQAPAQCLRARNTN